MELHEFIRLVQNFATLSHPERIKHFAWYLHHYRANQAFGTKEIREAYASLHMQAPPDVGRELERLRGRGLLLREGTAYRLEHRVREQFDAKYGEHESTVVISQLLTELPRKISDQAGQLFLAEALKCYRVQAFRSAIVMTWNLAYDHLLEWLVRDAGRLAAFNAQIVAVIGAKRGADLRMHKREDFEELRESQVLEIAGRSGVFASQNTKRILDMQLTKRNLAAHPSLVVIDRPQADDAISSLVSNVVLKLT